MGFPKGAFESLHLAGIIVCNFDEFNSGWTQVLTRPNKLPPKLKLSKGFRPGFKKSHPKLYENFQ